MSDRLSGQSHQCLTFTLGEERFALEISRVREVRDCTRITKVPRSPEFMRGVINLRGNVVPVIDLRLSLGMSATEQTVDTCIVIVETAMDGERMLTGMLADSVQEVIDLDPAQVESTPRLGMRMDTEFIKCMASHDNEFIMVLDTDRVLSIGELRTVETTIAEQETAA